jgi:asparagine synthase (glutamine-hydrolysing)
MSGICGVVTRRRGAVSAGDPEARAALLHRMASVMTHRGPDDAGFLLAGGPEGGRRLQVVGAEDAGTGPRRWDDGNPSPSQGATPPSTHRCRAVRDPQPLDVGLGMCRLAIIDPAGGHQPIGNEDGTVWLVFGGEIYNHREMRVLLERRGHRFATASDGETIVHAYEEYGPDCVRHLRGKFAFAIWDDPRRFLLLARDGVGAKPLFVAEVADRFLFASEIKALLQDPGLRREVNPEALYHYVTYGFVPEPQTMFRGIYQLPPGHLLAWGEGDPVVQEYWRGPEVLLAGAGSPAPKSGPRAAAPGDAWEAVQTAVADRLASDLPGPTRGCGVFLDGSLASAAVAAAMGNALDVPIPSFAAGRAGRDPALARSRRIARHLRTEHQEVLVGAEAEALWPRVIRHLDEPLADPGALPQFLLCQAARAHVTVALSSLGATLLEARSSTCSDRINRIFRIFGIGSRRPTSARIDSVNPVHPVRKATFEHPAVVAPGLFYGASKRTLFAAESEDRFPSSLGLAERFLERVAHLDPAGQEAYLYLKSALPGSSLLLADRLGMAFGLETREPFLASELLEYAFSSSRDRPSGEALLRQALAGHLPASVLSAPVAGTARGEGWPAAGAAASDAGSGELWEVVRAALAPDAVRSRGYFSPEAIQAMLREQQAGRGRHAGHLWALFALEIWHRIYLDHDHSSRADLTFEDLGLTLSVGKRSFTAQPQRKPIADDRSPAAHEGGRRSAVGGRPSLSLCAAERPLAILMATDDEPTVVTGGSSRLLREWSTRLAARGHSVTVLTRRSGPEQPARESWSDVDLVRYSAVAGHSVGRLNATLREGGRAMRRLETDRAFDVITVHHPLIGCAIRRGAPRGAPRLYTFLAPWADVSQEVRGTSAASGCARLAARGAHLAKRELERTAIDACDEVLVPSQYSAETVRARHELPEARVRRVPGGVDTERFRPRADRRELRRRLGLSESAFLILTVRPLTPMAGLEQLITAMSGITAVFPEAHLVIGGCPHPDAARHAPLPVWEAALRRQVAAQGLGGAITFAGCIPELLLPEYYAIADLFVMPSQSLEPLGLAAVESLSCGTPVFGTPVGALPEILGGLDPSALFAGTGAAQIADRIIRRLPDLHHDGALRRRCRQCALEQFSWDAIIPTLEAHLLDAVDRRRAGIRGQTSDASKERRPNTGARRWAPGAG